VGHFRSDRITSYRAKDPWDAVTSPTWERRDDRLARTRIPGRQHVAVTCRRLDGSGAAGTSVSNRVCFVSSASQPVRPRANCVIRSTFPRRLHVAASGQRYRPGVTRRGPSAAGRRSRPDGVRPWRACRENRRPSFERVRAHGGQDSGLAPPILAHEHRDKHHDLLKRPWALQGSNLRPPPCKGGALRN
jgi:hypothetical protein